MRTLTLILLLSLGSYNAQSQSCKAVLPQIDKILSLKISYEECQFKMVEKLVGSEECRKNLKNKRNKYTSAIVALRKNRSALKCLDSLIAASSGADSKFRKKFMQYKYVHPAVSKEPKDKTLKFETCLKVIRYSVFEINSDTLLPIGRTPYK